MSSLLEVEDIGVRFGGVVALDGLSFTIDAGQICALIGPNGPARPRCSTSSAGSTSPPTGTVTLRRARTCWRCRPTASPRSGIARTFQNLALVPGLSVLENVMVGGHARSRGGLLGLHPAAPAGPSGGAPEPGARPMEILERLDLGHLADAPVPPGCPTARSSASSSPAPWPREPKLLMLDEPASGLTHGEVDELGEMIRQIRDEFALTVLLVEHHMAMVMGISDKVVVMDFGRKIAEGDPGGHPQRPRGHRRLPGGGGDDACWRCRACAAGYGTVEVLLGLDLAVDAGEIVVMLGANGAGKTTTLRAVSGMIPAQGSVTFDGASALGRRPRTSCCGPAWPTCPRAGAPSPT